ncbi:hypothetical protein SAMN06265374_1788 [Roseibium denhamense]|uniref:Uncharacterized protein n=1 Tax=Roseibium denhamense TaxID=76305 RepID=A0ABY1NSQ4_9HYPH|nr:hypothetical protein SAMN06265374_1788 [Roseibium denhamense]
MNSLLASGGVRAAAIYWMRRIQQSAHGVDFLVRFRSGTIAPTIAKLIQKLRRIRP